MRPADAKSRRLRRRPSTRVVASLSLLARTSQCADVFWQSETSSERIYASACRLSRAGAVVRTTPALRGPELCDRQFIPARMIATAGPLSRRCVGIRRVGVCRTGLQPARVGLARLCAWAAREWAASTWCCTHRGGGRHVGGLPTCIGRRMGRAARAAVCGSMQCTLSFMFMFHVVCGSRGCAGLDA